MDKLIVIIIVGFIETFIGILLRVIFNIDIVLIYIYICLIIDVPLVCILDED